LSIRSGSVSIREKGICTSGKQDMPAIIHRQSGAENEFVQGALRAKIVAIVLATFALAVFIAASACVVFVAQPFGNRQWQLIAVGIALAAVTAGLFRSGGRSMGHPKSLERIFGRSLWLGKSFVWGSLASWLGLLAWSAVCPGGAIPPAKSDPAAIRVLTWNVLYGADQGTPWKQHAWPLRKKAMAAVLAGTKPNILCVQEALDAQAKYLTELMPTHRRVGVGRDDGNTVGEHCAILFDQTRFEELGGGTFWLEEPADRPANEFRMGPKRICTWVRLRDRQTSRAFRVYNVHQYLTEQARVQAARIILARIDEGDHSDAIVVTGDFNAPPDTQDRRLFEVVGLVSSSRGSGVTANLPTYQFYGIRLRRLDDILVDRSWRVLDQYVIDAKPDNTFPSDHFGVMADLMINE
jgi:endonuclease/exonuclease/phosphatase family metal-dependent hydrolase